MTQTTPILSEQLAGTLPQRTSKHYLGLETNKRDGIIELLLTYESAEDPHAQDSVNFAVLTEDGLRKYLAGAELRTAMMASGSQVINDDVGNKRFVAFRDSGRGQYTIIVHNNFEQTTNYQITVTGGQLKDGVGQTDFHTRTR